MYLAKSQHGARQPAGKMSPGQFAMVLTLASIGMLFGATVVAYLITRSTLDIGHGASAQVPAGMYLSTALLVAVSVSFQKALGAIRANRQRGLQRWLVLGSGFALCFLLSQGSNWFAVKALHPEEASRQLALFTFYLLTGVHALHVIGGFVPVAWVWARAGDREYSSSRHEGVQFCVQYWHFLGVTWLLLLGVMHLQ